MNRREYQRQAISSILKEFESSDRTTLLMACGTGKTLCGLWINSDLLRSKTTSSSVVFVPSLYLMKQTIDEYRKHFTINGKRLKANSYLAICSDSGVAAYDEIEETLEDIDFPVTTEVKDVRNYITSDLPHKIIFCTYHSASILGKAIEGCNYCFDFGLFDEAHRTASCTNDKEHSMFSYALLDKNVPISKRLFMTATRRHYDVADKQETLVFSMDDESIYGKVAYNLTFKSAVDQTIIAPLKVCIALINRKEVEEKAFQYKDQLIDAEKLFGHIAITKAIKEYGLNKFIGFTKTVADAKLYSKQHKIFKRLTGKSFSSYVSGSMPSAKRVSRMEKFRNAESGIMFNARCLTEGIDVPSVDGVIFFTVRNSKVDIVQACGRSMRLCEGKDFGLVLIPVLCDDPNTMDADQAARSSSFKQVYQIIRALVENDEELASIVSTNLLKQGERNKTRKTSLGDTSNPAVQVEFIGSSKEFNKLIHKVQLRISKTISRRPYSANPIIQGIDDIAEFSKIHKRLPKNTRYSLNERHYESKLAAVVSKLRASHKKGSLPKEHFDYANCKLGDFGIFNEIDIWGDNFQRMVNFVKETGGLPELRKIYNDANASSLQKWLNQQRAVFNRGCLSEEKIKKLDFFPGWNQNHDSFEAYILKIKAYIDTNNKLPSTKDKDTTVRNMAAYLVRTVRRYREGELDEQQKNFMDITLQGWFSVYNSWGIILKRLETFIQKEKRFPINTPDISRKEERSLYLWLIKNRSAYKAGTLTNERIKLLDSTIPGWVNKDPLSSWERKLEQTIEFVQCHKRLPKSSKKVSTDMDDSELAEHRLYDWIHHQCRLINKGENFSFRNDFERKFLNKKFLEKHLPLKESKNLLKYIASEFN